VFVVAPETRPNATDAIQEVTTSSFEIDLTDSGERPSDLSSPPKTNPAEVLPVLFELTNTFAENAPAEEALIDLAYSAMPQVVQDPNFIPSLEDGQVNGTVRVHLSQRSLSDSRIRELGLSDKAMELLANHDIVAEYQILYTFEGTGTPTPNPNDYTQKFIAFNFTSKPTKPKASGRKKPSRLA
jgi:hypothetical protein